MQLPGVLLRLDVAALADIDAELVPTDTQSVRIRWSPTIRADGPGLDLRSQGDDGIDVRGAARWKIGRKKRNGRQAN
jgi:hypothetical protein